MKLRVLIITFALLLTSNHVVQAAAPKAGAKCTKVGKVQIYQGLKFTCLKSGGKLKWNKAGNTFNSADSTGTTNPAIDPTIKYASYLNTPDPDAPLEWKEYQEFIFRNGNFIGPLRYVERTLGVEKPKQSYSQQSTAPINKCQPRQIHSYPILGFIAPEDQNRIKVHRHPSPNTVFQVLPVQWREYPGKNSPLIDYGKYFDLLVNWVRNNSDNGSKVSIKIPDRYYQLPKGIRQYSGIDTHGPPNEGGKIFFQDAVSSADPYIDFSASNIVLLVVPPNTPIEYLGNQPWSSGPVSDEGRVGNILTSPPHNLTKWHQNQILGTPGGWLHEIWHAGLDFGDHRDAGAMGLWGLMALNGMDLMGWEKYIAGFFSDDQVICADKGETGTFWIVPSSYKGAYKKLLVLPVNETRVLVIESMRSVGYNYMLPKMSQGALVYKIDTALNGYHEGEHVVVPSGRTDKNYLDAPLKLGESLVSEGWRITIVEAGLFGEVIRVEKA